MVLNYAHKLQKNMKTKWTKKCIRIMKTSDPLNNNRLVVTVKPCFLYMLFLLCLLECIHA